ncbi:uncharacterized protein LOC131937386 [Physella acuta]|uniref:uncharacterized protein LOC131937386 n=1 Tax=Physella acuta TaxID=109671 RepID=UPI0027DC4FD5|nr:uncharacterized protein LOC131937386 [Physella acuta]
MKNTTNLGLMVAVLASLLSWSAAHYSPSVYNLAQYCGSTISVYNDVRIVMTPNDNLYPNTNCTIKLQPYTGVAISASFVNYSMSPQYVDSSNNCPYISIFMTSDQGNYFGYRGYCGRDKPLGDFDMGLRGSISIKNWLNAYLTTPQVDLLVTEVFDRYMDGNCPYGKFDCQRQNYCIDDVLKCNGYDDCGNRRDETVGCRRPPVLDVNLQIGLIAGGSVCFLLIVIVVVVVVCKRRNTKGGYIQF